MLIETSLVGNWRMVKLAIAFLALTIAFLTSANSAVAVDEMVAFSQDGDKFVVVTQGNNSSETATATCYSFLNGRYSIVRKLKLPHRNLPERIIVPNKGFVVVAIGDLSERDEKTNAICVYDVLGQTSRIFLLNEVFDDPEISGPWNSGKGVTRVSSPGNRHFLAKEIFVNQENSRIVILAYSPDQESVAPLIEVDINRFEFQRINGDPLALEFQRLETAVENLISEISDSQLSELVGMSISLSRAQPRPLCNIQANFLVRVDPGNRQTHALARVFELDSETKEYVEKRTLKLFNLVLPRHCFLSTDGSILLTFDEFDSVGISKNATVIYDLERNLSKAFSVEDIFGKEAEMLESLGKVRIWHDYYSNIQIVPAVFKGLEPTNRSSDFPRITIDVRKLEVNVQK
jgi:hypothetical protein